MNMANFEYKKGTVLDFSSLLDHAPAGKFGRVIAGKDGHLALEKRSRPIRFKAFNFLITDWRGRYELLSHQELEDLADRIAIAGYNMVRFHFLDRFLLGRAWLPALNVGILAFAFGIIGVFLTSLSASVSWMWMLPMLVLPLLTPWWVKMFVKLSHHCQRATGNMTFNLLMDAGLIAGIWAMCTLSSRDEVLIGEDTLAMGALALAVLLFVVATRPYYKKKRVR